MLLTGKQKFQRGNTHILYDCRENGGFLEVTFLWIHPIHQNLCRMQLPRVDNNIDYRDNKFVYGYDPVSLMKSKFHFHGLWFVTTLPSHCTFKIYLILNFQRTGKN